MKNRIILPLLTVCLLLSGMTARASDCPDAVTVVVRTCEISRASECRWATTECGRRYSYMVLVVRYRSYLSDGSCRTFSRIYRA